MSFGNCKLEAFAGLALLCMGALLGAEAIADTTVESVRVSYVAEDLATPQGAAALYRHIKRAARLVCHQPNISAWDEYTLYQQCYDRAVDSAVAEVDSTALTALHHRQRGAAG